MSIRRGKIAWFLGLTFSLSWLLAWWFFRAGGSVIAPLAPPPDMGGPKPPSAILVLVLYMFIPATVALIVQRIIYKEPVVEPLGMRLRLNRWYLFAWLSPVVFSLAAFGLALLLPGVTYTPGMEGILAKFAVNLTPDQIMQAKAQIAHFPPIVLLLIVIAEGMIAGASVNMIAAFGEELGWRGFLLKELSPLGFWPASLLIGAIWGIWHAPIIAHGFNYPEHPKPGVAMMIVFCMLFAPLITYARLRARSVFAAALMHGTLNGTAGLAILFIRGGNDLTTGLLGLPGFIILLLANVALMIYDRGRVTQSLHEYESLGISDSRGTDGEQQIR